MKTISPMQYEWLCAVVRGDDEAVSRLGDMIPNGELYSRGLYTATPHALGNGYYEAGTVRLTAAGLDAIMCYRALTGQITISP